MANFNFAIYLLEWQCASERRRVETDYTYAAAKLLQSCLTLYDPIDSNPPGSPIPGILQARILERVAISSSSAWKWKVKVKLLCRVQLVATPWTAAHQVLPSMGFSRQEYWSGVPLPSLDHIYCYPIFYKSVLEWRQVLLFCLRKLFYFST